MMLTDETRAALGQIANADARNYRDNVAGLMDNEVTLARAILAIADHLAAPQPQRPVMPWQDTGSPRPDPPQPQFDIGDRVWHDKLNYSGTVSGRSFSRIQVTFDDPTVPTDWYHAADFVPLVQPQPVASVPDATAELRFAVGDKVRIPTGQRGTITEHDHRYWVREDGAEDEGSSLWGADDLEPIAPAPVADASEQREDAQCTCPKCHVPYGEEFEMPVCPICHGEPPKKIATEWSWGWYHDEDCAWLIGPGQDEPLPISSPGEWPEESKRRDVATDLCNTFVDLLNSRERAWREHCQPRDPIPTPAAPAPEQRQAEYRRGLEDAALRCEKKAAAWSAEVDSAIMQGNYGKISTAGAKAQTAKGLAQSIRALAQQPQTAGEGEDG